MTTVENYYAMPPVGMTVSRARIGEVLREGYTIRCGHRECWFVGHSTDEAGANRLLSEHTCPTPPARNELPSGYSTIEKLWDELDMATMAIMEGNAIQLGDQHVDGMQLRGYARGLAFALSMMCHPHFKTQNDIVREAAKRYKIRKGQIPYEPTPTYRFNPLPAPSSPPPGQRAAYHGATKAASPATVARTKPRGTLSKAAQAAAARVDLTNVTPELRTKIMNGTMTGFSHEDLAEMFNLTVETVRVIIDGRAS